MASGAFRFIKLICRDHTALSRVSLRQRRCASSSSGSSGFSLLTPTDLNDIVKLEVLMQEPSDRIKEIWSEYHTVNKSGLQICGNLDTRMDQLLRAKGKESPMFVFPVFKGSDDQYMVLFSQFQENMFILTYLEEYKRNPASAQPWMQITLYDELVKEKAIGLYRADFIPNLNKAESTLILKMLFDVYSDEIMYNSHVLTFNKHPEQFNFKKYFDVVKKMAVTVTEDS